jgi:uncharacterized protein with HEPN domain
MLISMWRCAPGYFHVDIFSNFRVIVLELVKISNFQHVSHVTQKIFDLESWNLTRMLIRMCSFAHGYFCVDIFSIFRVIALELVKICHFQLVSHLTKKVFDLESWYLTKLLLSMCSCAPGYFLLDIFRVIALDWVKICNFKLVSHVTQKILDLESWNLIGMSISMWSCAPGYYCLDIFSIFRVIALELVKISNFQLVSHVTKKVFDLESWNLRSACAPGYFRVDIFSIFRVIALDLLKIYNIQLVLHVTKKIFGL